MRIKLCGLRRQEDIDAVNRYLPDFAGFVFASSPRQVDARTAAELIGLLCPSVKSVGVFVNEPLERLGEIVKEAKLDIVQLHGDENEDYVTAAKKLGLPVWKAVRVRTAQDIRAAQKFPVDALLLDSFLRDAYGGTGKVANWEAIAQARPQMPFFLAGGLHAGNIAEAVRQIKPYGVDISGGIETDGYKDREKIRQIMGVLRGL